MHRHGRRPARRPACGLPQRGQILLVVDDSDPEGAAGAGGHVLAVPQLGLCLCRGSIGGGMGRELNSRLVCMGIGDFEASIQAHTHTRMYV